MVEFQRLEIRIRPPAVYYFLLFLFPGTLLESPLPPSPLLLLLPLLLQVANVPTDSVDLYDRRRLPLFFFLLDLLLFTSRSMAKVTSRRSLCRDEDVILKKFPDRVIVLELLWLLLFWLPINY